jgi:hypothetical protein
MGWHRITRFRPDNVPLLALDLPSKVATTAADAAADS